MQAPQPDAATRGTDTLRDITDVYIRHITDHVRLARPMRIAIDCGNGVGAVIAARLYRALGCDIDELYCSVDGSFPNHHPDPPEPPNLKDLIRHVRTSDCQLGLALAADAILLSVMTKDAQILQPDLQLISFTPT